MFVFCLQTVLRIRCQILLLSLTTWGVIAENHQLFLSKNKYIENKVLTAGTVGYIAEMSSVGIVQCSMKCAAYKSGCGGLFYHPQSESCKLLTSPLTEALAYDVRLGWSFWSQNREFFLIEVIKLVYEQKIRFASFRKQTQLQTYFSACEIGWFYFKDHCYFRDQTSLNWASAKVSYVSVLM